MKIKALIIMMILAIFVVVFSAYMASVTSSLLSNNGQYPEKINLTWRYKIKEAFFSALMECEGYSETEGPAGELGYYQLTKTYVDDVNRILGIDSFTYEDRLDKGKAEMMVLIYTLHYATAERLGREPMIFDLVRIHQGGPDGWKKDCTIDQAKRVINLMNERLIHEQS